ncbi:PIN domain-containing protein [Methylocystis sp.]|uniref:type II toxin-antitoxin system VapC family toxin n=1 Tax=Methylocystis sp. TaxID=1911079 RepID=UPI00273631A2|nr:PIN domain-containing protein [Methylocystis sp.]MDP3552810.1 PIN domain-containing protein [Methylocystis sp.]
MIVVDANFLVLLFDPDAMQHVDRGHERVVHFIETMTKTREEVMIPAVVLTEVVAGRIDRVEEIVETIRRERAFIVQPLDEVIAIETGYLIRAAKEQIPSEDRQPGWRSMMKYDAIVAATAAVRGARAILTDNDRDFRNLLANSGVEVITLTSLPTPPEKQEDLFES